MADLFVFRYLVPEKYLHRPAQLPKDKLKVLQPQNQKGPQLSQLQRVNYQHKELGKVHATPARWSKLNLKSLAF